jgi:uncharacterized protein YndB with AHSA1/START domain
MSDRIEQEVELRAPIARVWRALTDHREFGTWFRVELEQPFAVGATARGRITYPGFEHVVWQAVVQRIDAAAHVFSFTWHPYSIDPAVDYSQEPPTLVEFRLAASATGTRLTVTESGFDRVPAARRGEAFLRHQGGWATQMNNVRAHVEPAP